jgi:hypothetical protein
MRSWSKFRNNYTGAPKYRVAGAGGGGCLGRAAGYLRHCHVVWSQYSCFLAAGTFYQFSALAINGRTCAVRV